VGYGRIVSMPKTEEGMMKLQARLARAERFGDLLVMARGYLVIAGELWRSGDRRLGAIFVRRAEECLASVVFPDRSDRPDG
jgi:hypothetical protein